MNDGSVDARLTSALISAIQEPLLTDNVALILVTSFVLHSQHGVDQLLQFISEEVSPLVVDSSSSWIRALFMSFSFWRCSAADSGPALAGSAAGFNQPAAICARDIMLFETASPSLCQFKPAVPVHQLTPRVLSSSFCRQRDYAMQRRPEMMTFCDFPSVRLISHLLSLPSRSPPVTRFPLSQLCRCCWTSPPRPTLL